MRWLPVKLSVTLCLSLLLHRTDNGDYAASQSVLILNDNWEEVYHSTSSLNRQLAFVAHNAGCKVYMTTLPYKDYKTDGIEGIGRTLKVGNNICDNRSAECMLFYDGSIFSATENIANIEVIIGHVPTTSQAAISLKEKSFPNSRLFLFVSNVPEGMENFQRDIYEEWESLTIKASEKADAVFSVGPKVFSILNKTFRAASKQINHLEYFPFPENDYFDINMTLPGETSLKHVVSYEHMIGVKNVENINIFIAKAFGNVSKKYHDIAEKYPSYIIKGVPNQYHDVINNNIFESLSAKDKYLDIRLPSYGTKDENKRHLKQSDLVLLSSRRESFGMPALEAMAAGVPVLVTANSGLAQFIRKEFLAEAKQMIVDVGVNAVDLEGDIDTWGDRIIYVLRDNYTARFEVAQRIKVQLKVSVTLKESRERFEKELKKGL